MKNIGLILLFMITGLAIASPVKSEKFKNTKNQIQLLRGPQSGGLFIKKCQQEFSNQLLLRGSEENWVEQAPAMQGGKTFRTPTIMLGTWLEASVDAVGNPRLFQVDANQTLQIDFSDQCQAQLKPAPGLDFKKLNPDSLSDWYDDKQLAKTLSSKRAGLIYVWSPDMVYSAKHYKWFRDVAREMNLEFVPLLDPRCKLTQVDKMSIEYGIPSSKLKLNSVELYMRNVTVHFPTAIIFKGGKLHETLIVGAMPRTQIEEQIKMILMR